MSGVRKGTEEPVNLFGAVSGDEPSQPLHASTYRQSRSQVSRGILMAVEYRVRADEHYYVTAHARYRRQLWWCRWVRPAGVLVWITLAAVIYFSNGAPADWPSIGLFLFVLLAVAALIFSAPLTRAVSAAAFAKSRHSTMIGYSVFPTTACPRAASGVRDGWTGAASPVRGASPTASCFFEGPICFTGFPIARAPSRHCRRTWAIW